MVGYKYRPLRLELGDMIGGAVEEMATDYFNTVKATDPSYNLAEDSNQVGEFDRGTMGGT